MEWIVALVVNTHRTVDYIAIYHWCQTFISGDCSNVTNAKRLSNYLIDHVVVAAILTSTIQ